MMENNAVNQNSQTGNSASQQQGGTGGGVNQQQQQVMAQVFSNFLTRFMSIASENANNS